MYNGLVADSAELTKLKHVFEDYCRAQGIVDKFGRDTVAHRLIIMYSDGTRTKAELLAGLSIQA